MAPLGGGELTIVLLCHLLGACGDALYNLVFQSAIIRAVPSGTAAAMSVYSGIYNVGIGSRPRGRPRLHPRLDRRHRLGGRCHCGRRRSSVSLRVGPVMRGVFAKS